MFVSGSSKDLKSNNFNVDEYLKSNLKCFSPADSLAIIKVCRLAK